MIEVDGGDAVAARFRIHQLRQDNSPRRLDNRVNFSSMSATMPSTVTTMRPRSPAVVTSPLPEHIPQHRLNAIYAAAKDVHFPPLPEKYRKKEEKD